MREAVAAMAIGYPASGKLVTSLSFLGQVIYIYFKERTWTVFQVQ